MSYDADIHTLARHKLARIDKRALKYHCHVNSSRLSIYANRDDKGMDELQR